MATRVEGVEPALATIWAEVLDLEHVAPEDDFFELGGTSLLAMQIVARATDAFGVELALDALFEAPTVAGLAHAIEAAQPASAPRRARRRGRREPPMLSDLQASAWAVQRYRPDVRPFTGTAHRLEGPLDVAALERALTELVARHEILRTIFPSDGERPVPRVLPPEPVSISVQAIARSSRQQGEAELSRLVEDAQNELFDLEAQPPLRIRLFRRGPTSHALVLMTHEIVCDGWGYDALVRELSLLYNACAAGQPSPLPEPALQYADIVGERAERGAGRTGDTSSWRGLLADAPLTLPLPPDAGGRPPPAHDVGIANGQVPARVSAGLRTLGGEEAATSFMIHLAALYAVLHANTGEPRLLVNVPAANRVRTELEGVIGFLSRILPLCVEVGDDPSFRTLLRRTREATLHAFAHAGDLPENNRIRELAGLRGLLGVGVVFRLWDATLERRLELAEIRSEPFRETSEEGMVALAVTEHAGRGTSLELSSTGLGRAGVEAMLDQYQRVLEEVAQDPDRRLGAIELLGETQRRQVVAGWNPGRGDEHDARCLHRLVEAQAVRTPDAIALRWALHSDPDGEGELMTYGALDAEAWRLARHLLRQGVERGTRVGFELEPSAGLVVAMLAVLKAGGVCVLPGAHPPQMMVTPATRAPPAGAEEDGDGGDVGSGATAEDVALELPTAGVTGAPKTVELTHRTLVHAAAWRQHAYRLSPSDRVLQVPGPGVLAWGLSFWAALAAGAQVAIPEHAPDAPGPRVVHWLDACGVTHAALPPALAASCLTSPDVERTALRTLVVQGHGPLPAPPADRRTRVVAFREYALAEAGGLVFSTRVREASGAWDPLASESPTALSTPAYVLDAALRPLPPGAAGELWLGGAGIARGYAGDPERTAQAFAEDPFAGSPGARLVRTGDLARRRFDGTLEVLGRMTDEVRFRGFRMAPCMHEVEEALAEHPGVAAAATRWDADSATLVAYVAPLRGTPPETVELDRWLQERMRDWLLPGRYLTVERVPLRPDGSPDRAALARTGTEPLGPDPARIPPATRTEKKLHSIWRKVLARRGIGVNEPFYALGGDLIRGIEMIERARRAGIRLNPQDLMLRPTIAELAALADRRRG